MKVSFTSNIDKKIGILNRDLRNTSNPLRQKVQVSEEDYDLEIKSLLQDAFSLSDESQNLQEDTFELSTQELKKIEKLKQTNKMRDDFLNAISDDSEEKLVELIKSKDFDPNYKVSFGIHTGQKPALVYLVENQKYEALEAILEKKEIDPNLRESASIYKENALDVAIRNQDLKAIDLLTSHKKTNVDDAFTSAMLSDNPLVRMKFDKNFDVNKVFAQDYYHLPEWIMTELIKRDDFAPNNRVIYKHHNITSVDEYEITVAGALIMRKQYDALRELVKKENLKIGRIFDTERQWTPFHLAAQRGDKEAIEILKEVENFVFTDGKDAYNRQPHHVAWQYGNFDIIDDLKEVVKKPEKLPDDMPARHFDIPLHTF